MSLRQIYMLKNVNLEANLSNPTAKKLDLYLLIIVKEVIQTFRCALQTSGGPHMSSGTTVYYQ